MLQFKGGREDGKHESQLKPQRDWQMSLTDIQGAASATANQASGYL